MSDLFNRSKNLVFTTTGKYDMAVREGKNSVTDGKTVTIASEKVLRQVGLNTEQIEAVALAASMHEAGHINHTDIKATSTALVQAQKEGFDAKKLFDIVNILEDVRIDKLVAEDRPGYTAMSHACREAYTPFIKPTGNVTQDTLKYICGRVNGIDLKEKSPLWADAPLDWKTIDNIVGMSNDIVRNAKSTDDILKHSKSVYDELFKKEPDDKKESEDDDKGEPTESKASKGKGKVSKGKGEGKDSDEKPEPSDDKEEDDYDDEDDYGEDSGDEGDEDTDTTEDATEEEIEDMIKEALGKDSLAEMAKDDGRLSDIVEKEKRRAKSLDERVEEYEKWKGRLARVNTSVWSEQEEARINDTVTRDMFAGTYVRYVYNASHRPGKLFPNKWDVAMGKTMGTKLKELLRDSVQDSELTTTSGRLKPTSAYRYAVNDPKLFMKREYADVGGYRVDVLVDASGSQRDREYDIKCQLTVLAAAFIECGIPCRISQFDNHANAIRIKRLKDYDDTDVSTALLLSVGSDNLDGVVYRALWEDIQMRKFSEKHIIFVLSDGEPCSRTYELTNKYGETTISGYSPGHKWSHEGVEREVVQDIVMTFNKIRKHAMLMGIYVGNSKRSLAVEKRMFGNDFAWIKTMQGFVPTIMNKFKAILK